jgi:phosphopantothenate-cysteine ligase
MHRQHSLQPFSRHYSHSTNPFLDFLELEERQENGTEDKNASPPAITVRSSDHLRDVLSQYKAVHRAGTLHTLTFVTVNEYLWLLRAVSKELNALGRKAMYYLAAAVSDFFLPREKMVSTLSIVGPTIRRNLRCMHMKTERTQDSIRQRLPYP